MTVSSHQVILVLAVASAALAWADDRFPADRINIVAKIDGSDELLISHQGTRCVHKSWDDPTAVQVNGQPWNPQRMPVIVPGLMGFLQRQSVDLSGAELHKVRGRGSVQLSHDAKGLVITFDDPENGADIHEVNLDFAELLAGKQPERTNDVEFRVRATIDGTDSITFSQHTAAWLHTSFRVPTDVTINGRPWDLAEDLDWALRPALTPEAFDLQRATVIKVAGRGWVHLEYRPEFVRLDLEDHELGADKYDAIVKIPPCQRRHLIRLQADVGNALLGVALSIYRIPENNDALALVPGQRVFDEDGQCLVALESGQYQFEVQRQDSQMLLALKTDATTITGPTNINLPTVRSEPKLYNSAR